jgi:dUTP pyrophosphatase
VNELLFKRLHPVAVIPTRANAHDAGLDLRTIEAVELAPGQQQAVRTGLAVAVPVGKVGLLFARSGNAAKQGITLANAVGVIDSGFRGEVKVLLSHQGGAQAGVFSAQPGDRIAQLVLVDCDLSQPAEVDELPAAADSRRGGFGSTGRA